MKTKKRYMVILSLKGSQAIVSATSKAEAKQILIARLIKKGIKKLIDHENSSVDIL